jgi:hypothetical protein
MLKCIEVKLLSAPPTKKEKKENQQQLKKERKTSNNKLGTAPTQKHACMSNELCALTGK